MVRLNPRRILDAYISIAHRRYSLDSQGCGSSTDAPDAVNAPLPEDKRQAKEVVASPHHEKVAAVSVAEEQKPAPPAAEEAAPAAEEPAAEEPAAEEEELIVPSVEGSLPEDSTIIFVLGGPGSGKGTQCDKIKARYSGVVHLSAGDLLRAEVESGSAVGTKCASLMKEGKLVPMPVTIALLKNAMIASGGSLFLIDGFPRAMDQGIEFESSIMECKAVIFFDCPEDEMQKRLIERGKTSGRADDNAETIMKRFKTFVTQSLPVKEYYLEKSKCHVISAVPPPTEVFAEVVKALDAILPASVIPAAEEPAPDEEEVAAKEPAAEEPAAES
jgi:adenylate kinase family enzyme